MKRTCFVLLVWLCAVANGKGQQMLEDSIKINDFLNQAGSFYAKKTDSFEYYLNLAYPLLKKYNKRWGDTYIGWRNAQSSHYYNIQDFRAFNQNTLEVLKECDQYLDVDNKNKGDALNNRGLYLRRTGDFDQAISFYKKAVQIFRKSNRSAKDIITTLQNLSIAYRNKGDYDQGIEILKQVLQIQRDSSDALPATARGKTYLDLGHLYRDKGDMDLAKINYLQSDQLFSEHDLEKNKSLRSNLIYCYQSLSKTYLALTKIDSSYFFIQKAIALESDRVQFRKIVTLEILGDLYFYEKQNENALAAYFDSNEASLEYYGENKKSDVTARTFLNIAKMYASEQAPEKALDYYQKGLIALSVSFDTHSIETNPEIDQMLSKSIGLEIISGKAKSFLHKYNQRQQLTDLQAAFQNYQFSSDIIRELRNTFIAEGSKNELAENSLEIYEGGIKAAYLLFQKTGERKYKEAAWVFAEQNKARLLEESLKADYAKAAGGLPVDQLEEERRLAREINFYKGKINREQSKLKGGNEEKIKLWETALFEANNQYNDLISSFEKDYPRYHKLKYDANRITVNTISKKILDSEKALLEYFVGEESLFLFFIDQKGLKIFELDKSENFVEEVTNLRAIISQSPFGRETSFEKEQKQFTEIAYHLYQSLLAPAMEEISPDVDQLLIIPDDILAYLPFELLLSKEADPSVSDYAPDICAYLMKDYAISYNYSSELLLDQKMENENADIASFIGFAPSFGREIASSRSCTGDEVYTLQCNAKEIMAINEVFNGKVLDGPHADTRSFEEYATNYKILHLATHACIDEANPDLNKIYFADSYITGTDLNNLQLNAELAVLSACNTGSGKLVRGEGVMSLSRSFILAGCPSTLTSLWSVDDCTTSDIMIDFYKKLKEGLSKDEAIRQAKLNHLRKADRANQHPYFWAAFIQSGTITPITNEGLSPYFYLLFIPIILLIFYFVKRK